MNHELEKLCNKNEYDKIYSAVKAWTTRQALLEKSPCHAGPDMPYLQRYAEQRIMACLYKEESIPDALVNLILLFGPEHLLSLKTMVTNYLVAQALAELTQFIAANFSSPGSLKQVYDFLEGLVEGISGRHHNLPAEWNVELRLICRAFVIIKQQVCDYFFVNETEESTYVHGLFATIALEKRLQPFLAMKGCCSHQIEFAADEIHTLDRIGEVRCIHERMLSSIFLSHIGVYFSHVFRPFLYRKFNQDICELNIVGVFPAFFREVGRTFGNVCYFEDASVFREFLLQLDFYLCQLARRLAVDERLGGALVVLSTIIYVRETMADLREKLSQYCTVDFVLDIFDDAAEIERRQARRVEALLAESFVPLKAAVPDAGALCEWFRAHAVDAEGASDEVRAILLEMGMAHLLVRIGQLKMSQETSEALLDRVCDLERYLGGHFAAVPHIRTIAGYLKVFACPTDNRERFVENFRVLSAGLFSFSQILSAMENQDDAAELFVQYKKTSK